MANYTIIGGDGKQYGPITTEDLYKWITEGRLNAQSQVKAESDAEFRALAAFPEFADALKIQNATPESPTPFAVSTDGPERDYELDIGGCVSRGWELVKNNFGTLFVSFAIMLVISMVAGGLLNGIFSLLPQKIEVVRQIVHLLVVAALAPIMGPLTAGVYYLFIRAHRGQAISIGEMFIGFQNFFKELFVGYLVVTLVIGVCMIPYNVVNDLKVLGILEQMRHAQPAEVQNLVAQLWPALFSTLPVLLICLIPITYLSVNWQFTLPLIIDKQIPFWTAMKTSWKMVHKHWWQVFGLTVVVGLVGIAGALACCVGVLVTIPIGIGAMMFAYETIFGAEKK
jgi:uncharacterized membrane protein